MKKIISVIVALVLLVSVFTLTASAEENYCELFEKQWLYLGCVESYGDENTPWSADTIAYITGMCCDYEKYINKEKMKWFEENEGYGVEYYCVPATEFESLASKLFDVKVNLKTANFNDICTVKYESSTNTYDIIFYPRGGGNFYTVYGYSKLGSVYTVYMQKEADGENLFEYAKATATCDGKYAKLISFAPVSRVPAQNTLITPSAIKDTPTQNTSSNTSSATDSSAPQSSEVTSSEEDAKPVVFTEKNGVKIEGAATAFPESVVIKIEKENKADTLASIKNSVKDLTLKFTAYQITATDKSISVQPDGSVKATFKIPEGYNTDKIAVIYVSDSGKAEVMASTVNKENGTVTAELSHFSTYLVAETRDDTHVDTNDTDTTVGEEKKGKGWVVPVIIISVVLLAGGGAAAWYFLIYKKKK